MGGSDCVLSFWATDPLLEKAFDVIHSRVFEYKTVGFYWAKLRKPEPFYNDGNFFTGLGFWTRVNPESFLLATRGKPSPPGWDRCGGSMPICAKSARGVGVPPAIPTRRMLRISCC